MCSEGVFGALKDYCLTLYSRKGKLIAARLAVLRARDGVVLGSATGGQSRETSTSAAGERHSNRDSCLGGRGQEPAGKKPITMPDSIPPKSHTKSLTT